MKEIEQDGYITRDADLTGQKRTCSNCEHYVYSLFLKCYVCSEGHSVSDNNGCPISDAVFALDKAIEALSADRPQGEWIDFKSGWKCSACGKWNNETSNFCPNCGAKMKGANDEH